jgi:hypothetical protein
MRCLLSGTSKMTNSPDLTEIRELTKQLRAGAALYWHDLRDLLAARGFLPSDLVAAYRLVDEDTDFLVLVLPDDRAVEIEYVDRDYVEGRQPRITAWEEVIPGTSDWSVYGEHIQLARLHRNET